MTPDGISSSSTTSSQQQPPPSASITTLLNSLHTHLQAQTQLLPTLHAQLGLPPTALADELAALQHALTRCVEDQIDGRRRQVGDWLARCEELEAECARYGAALGANAKGAGMGMGMGSAGGVGEMRKEQVLPRRYEMLAALQERLRQVYHTKLEQLTTLTNRIAALSRTLGDGFFAQDILEPKAAGGADVALPETHRDVTPERFSKLEKELVRGKGEVSKRLAQLAQTFVQIDWLHTELGIDPPTEEELQSPVASSSSLHVPALLPRPSASSLLSSSTNADPFLCSTSTPTPGSRTHAHTPALFLTASSHTSEPDSESSEQHYQLIFARFVSRLNETASDAETDAAALAALSGVEPTPALLAWAERLRGALEDTKRRREAHIQAMYDQLEGLWRRLGVRDADMDAFVDAHCGSTAHAARMYEEELERMLELKRERMGAFVENARAEIQRLWDEMMVGGEERADFAPFFDDEHTEELLVIHEEEITRLKEERRLKAPLLGSIRKYFEICDEEKELAAAASDQSRLLGRGPRDPGRLLREEKMRKRVQKEKPRLEQDLLAALPGWEATARRPFLVHGQSMLQHLLDAVGDKENHKRKPSGGNGSRAGSVPPRSTTPGTSYAKNSNGTGNMVTPAVRPASSMAHTAPNKRQRVGLGESSNNAPPPATGRKRSGSATSKIAAPVPVRATSSSSLPRPVVVPRPGTQHHALGHGRVPSAQVPAAYHGGRSVSSTSATAATAYALGMSRSTNLNLNLSQSQSRADTRKARAARRESFKPRPSVDGGAGAGAVGWGKRYVGMEGVVKEEDSEGGY